MRICLVTHCFYPSVMRGGPTVSMINLAKLLAKYADVTVLTINREMDGSQYTCIEEGRNEYEGCGVYYLSDNTPSAFYHAIKMANPDVIYISSLFSWQYSVSALLYGKKHRVRTILAPRGELMPSAIAGKKVVKQLFLDGLSMLGCFQNIIFHATSEAEIKSIRRVFPKAKIEMIKNLPTVIEQQQTHKRSGELGILISGRLHPIKNTDIALSLTDGIQGNIHVFVCGNEENKEYTQNCRDIAARLPDNISVSFCGVLKHEQIPEMMKKCHILLSPTKSENFGQSIVEALLAGKPVVISDNTPWRDLEQHMAGFDIPLSRMEDFGKTIQRFADMNEEEYVRWCHAARQYIVEALKLTQVEKQYISMIYG